MKTKNNRLEMLESFETPKEFVAIKQDLDNRELYSLLNKESGEKEYMTLEEAEKRYKDCTLVVVSYSDNWKSPQAREDLDKDLEKI